MASRKRCQRWLKSGTRRRLLRLLDGWNGLSRVFRVGALEDDDGDPPARSLAVLVEAGHLPGVLPIEALVVLLAVDDPRSGLERVAEGLDLDDLVRQALHVRFIVVGSRYGRLGAPSGACNPVGDLRRHGSLWRRVTAWFRQRPVQLQGTLVPALEERLAGLVEAAELNPRPHPS